MPAESIQLDVKNKALIVSNDILNDCRVVVIKNDCHLSDVFNSMPCGIVRKGETGMGATRLELTSSRPSIIVEPLKITAYTKSNIHDALYYGSEIARTAKPTRKEVIKWLDSRPENKRKVLVVADSLPDLVTILGESFNGYFLLIDEMDSFQIDSNFRESMSVCIDIYKNHPFDKRAMVTATPLIFSDEDLQKENRIEINYSELKRRNIELIHYKKPPIENENEKENKGLYGVVVDRIKEIISALPEHKIMVAYNYVHGCFEIANHLAVNDIVALGAIKILCSKTSKAKAKEFYSELLSDQLPAKVNFFTSAYFTGFDLNESYSLISISNAENGIYLLSEHRLKQIAGRCRKELLTETIIYTTASYTSYSFDATDLIKAANIEMTALNCIKSNYEDSPLLVHNFLKFREYIVGLSSDTGVKYLREDKNRNVKINYLSIDAYVEENRVRNNLYRNKNQLPNVLKTHGHFIELTEKGSKTVVEKIDISSGDKKSLIEGIINEILSKTPEELQFLSKKKLKYPKSEIIKSYLDNYLYLEKEDVLKILRSHELGNNKQFKNLNRAALFYTLPPEDNIKNKVLSVFKIGESYSRQEIYDKWNEVFAGTGLLLNKKTIPMNNIITLTNSCFHTTKERKKRSPEERGLPLNITIVRENPEKFTRLTYRKRGDGEWFLNY